MPEINTEFLFTIALENFAGENPDDIRMRWIAQAQHMGFEPDQVDVYFIAGAFKISEMAQRIAQELAAIGPVDLSG